LGVVLVCSSSQQAFQCRIGSRKSASLDSVRLDAVCGAGIFTSPRRLSLTDGSTCHDKHKNKDWANCNDIIILHSYTNIILCTRYLIMHIVCYTIVLIKE